MQTSSETKTERRSVASRRAPAACTIMTPTMTAKMAPTATSRAGGSPAHAMPANPTSAPGPTIQGRDPIQRRTALTPPPPSGLDCVRSRTADWASARRSG
jgi:hypothetical protein